MNFLYYAGVFGCILFLAVAAVCGVILLICALAKKERKRIRFLTLLFLGVGLLCLVLFASIDDISSGLLVLALLGVPTAIILLVAGLVRKHRKQSGRRCFIASAIVFGAVVCLFVGFSLVVIARFPGKNARSEDYEIIIQTDYDFEVVDGAEPLEVVTSTGCNTDESYIIHSYRIVYDSCDLHYVLDNCDATAEDCLATLGSNPDIPAEYKAYFADFIGRIAEIYPDANLSILCENLKTLQVVELNALDYLSKSLSFDSYGCYMRTENTIYIPEGTEYIEGEWGFQVLIHEFCHAARTRWVSHDGIWDKMQYCSESDNTLLEESMNSAFSCSLLNYYERDIAYQVPSNYLRIMLECMDNYTLDDYLNHSDLYFLSCLDEYTGCTNYAQVIWKLIALQRSDWQDDQTDISPEEYEPIYDYLCKMYYGKYITPDMTEEERLAVAKELVDKAFFDAPEGYKINSEYFYEYAENYNG